MPLLSESELLNTALRVLDAVGTPQDLADIVARSLVDANLYGHDSHGIMRLSQYAHMARSGKVIANARATRAHQFAATARIDGAWGWGQPAAHLAADTALTLAAQFGIGAVTLYNANHIGRVGTYVQQIAAAGCIGFAVCNAGARVAPHGGAQAMLGTNPIAFAAPRSNSPDPILVDLATSAVAEGKVRVTRDAGKVLAPGLVIDRNGNPSQDPHTLYDGGALLPIGGHKGYALSVMVELLGGALSGTGFSASSHFASGNGTFVLALSPAAFGDTAQFATQVDELHARLTGSPPSPDAHAVLVPGDPEWMARDSRRMQGIDIPDDTWRAIMALL
jgi:uncharacterized oxidoreductase